LPRSVQLDKLKARPRIKNELIVVFIMLFLKNNPFSLQGFN
jgi:hypothetical protein